jgi:YHS domain-containing protein/thioredoxin-related protein
MTEVFMISKHAGALSARSWLWSHSLIILLAFCASASAADAIPWRTNFEQALNEAQTRNMPVWIQFTGPWCGYCRKMEREVFVLPEVVAASQRDYIPVKIRSDEREDLLSRYGVTGLPTTIIAMPNGDVVTNVSGYSEPGAFLGFLGASKPDLTPAEVALAGYSPVSLVEGHGLTTGQSYLAVRYDGQVYYFANARERDRFLKSPEAFLPSNRGHCIVSLVEKGKHVRGNPNFGVYYDGRMYLCADEAARRRFADDPKKYAAADLAENGNCPHCKGLAGRLVRGLPQFSQTFSGRRYLFPDAFHLEAFRAAPEKFLRR